MSILPKYIISNFSQTKKWPPNSKEIYKKANGGYMLRDISKPLKVLPIHAKLQTKKNYSSNLYYCANTKKENLTLSSWIPLLPDHCVIRKFGNLYVRLEIQSNNEKSLTYNWKIYEDMEISQMIYSETNNDFFVSMKKYIKLLEEISIPDILELCDPNIIQDLQARVKSVYPNIFSDMIVKTKSQKKKSQN
ncbi:hypothetical protein C1646_761129 [Rhizophagus diaphanus]|nr:hypothetical protein C1646_761129 [Rhizophagus diaphanus] [Rhizophagus sp. MUCL 43196]